MFTLPPSGLRMKPTDAPPLAVSSTAVDTSASATLVEADVEAAVLVPNVAAPLVVVAGVLVVASSAVPTTGPQATQTSAIEQRRTITTSTSVAPRACANPDRRHAGRRHAPTLALAQPSGCMPLSLHGTHEVPGSNVSHASAASTLQNGAQHPDELAQPGTASGFAQNNPGSHTLMNSQGSPSAPTSPDASGAHENASSEGTHVSPS
jgi:hypothetical protein